MLMFNEVFREKSARVLLTLKDTSSSWHLSKLAKSCGVTYIFVTKLMSKLEQVGIVSFEMKGKKKVVTLTEKGIQIVNMMDEIKKRIEEKSQ